MHRERRGARCGLRAAAYAAQPLPPAELRSGPLERAWFEGVELKRPPEFDVERVVVREKPRPR